MSKERDLTIHQVSASFREIRKHLFNHKKLSIPHSLTLSQGFVLGFIENQGPASVGEIAVAFSVTSSAATQIIDTLVKRGFLGKKESTDDRRILQITLTKKGKNVIKEFKTAQVDKLKDVLEPLSDNDLKQYLKLSRKVLDCLYNKEHKKIKKYKHKNIKI